MSLVGYGALAAGLAALGYAAVARGDRHAMVEIETTPIREITDGPHELKGRGELLDGGGYLRRAPFTNDDAIAASYDVLEIEGGDMTWETEARGEYANPFLLSDETGTVYVDPADADVRFDNRREREIRVEGGQTPPEPVQRFVDRTRGVEDENYSMDVAGFTLSRGDDRKYKQRVVKPTHDLYVLGDVTPLSKVDVDGEVRQTLKAEDVSHVVDSGDTFVVSNMPEELLVRSSGRKMRLAAVVGAVLLAVAAFFLLG